MSDSVLSFIIQNDLERNTVKVWSEIKHDQLDDILTGFLGSQMGAGADESEADNRTVYTIAISIDLSDDTFYVKDDTGNKGLRDGILYKALQSRDSWEFVTADEIQKQSSFQLFKEKTDAAEKDKD